MNELLTTLNTFTPLGIAALALFVLWQTLTKNKRMDSYKKIAENHTSCLPEMMDYLKRMEGTLTRIENTMTRIDVKINGK